MRFRANLLVGSALFLSACASERWPGQSDNLASAHDYPVVQQRYDAASKNILGTSDDVVKIKKAILQTHPELNIDEIRWISKTEVIAYTDRGRNLPIGYESFYCAVEKQNGKWRFVGWYLHLIS